VVDRRPAALGQLVVHLTADRFDARLEDDLRDPGRHRPQTDDSYSFDAHLPAGA
jgi:hypothetical protein